MNINIVRHVNNDEGNRIEFLFVNYDYYDGNDLVAKIVNEKFGIDIGEKMDGLFYTVIPLYDKDSQYNLVWHEDIGNYAYSIRQDKDNVEKLQKLMKLVVVELNQIFAKSRI